MAEPQRSLWGEPRGKAPDAPHEMKAMSFDPDLNRTIAVGAIWTHAVFLASKLVVFATTVVLARLLSPDDFGLVAVGLIVLAFTEAMSDVGAGAAVVWRRDDPHRTAAVAMALGLIGAVVGGGLTFAAAPAIATFFGDDRIATVVRVLSVSFLLTSPASVLSGLLQHQLAFRRRVVPEIGKSLVKGIISIGLAVAGFGVWSLVYGHIAGLLAGLLMLWWLSRWRPHLSLKKEVLRDILPYGAQIILITLLGITIKNIDYLIIGRWFDTATLGVYVLAFSLIDQFVMGICWAASQALFPAYSLMQSDPAALRRASRDGLHAIAAITLPAAAGFAIVAEPMILVFYGEKWLLAVPIMQAMAFYAMIYAVAFNIGDIYKATGRPYLLTLIAVANLVLAVPILVVSASWGVVGVAYGQVLVAALIAVANWVVASRVIGIDWSVFVGALGAPVMSTAVMAIACLGAGRLVDQSGAVTQLLLLLVVGVFSYTAALALTAPRLVRAVGAIAALGGRSLLRVAR